MLHYTIIIYNMIYYTIIIYCEILWYTILYYTILHYTIIYYTIPYHTEACGNTIFLDNNLLFRRTHVSPYTNHIFDDCCLGNVFSSIKAYVFAKRMRFPLIIHTLDAIIP